MACSCIKANEKTLGNHNCSKSDNLLPLKNKSSIYQEKISRINVDITKKDNETLGLTVSGGADRGETPVIANIRPGSIAERSDIFLIGDHIISINGISTSSLCHQEIVSLVKSSKPKICLIIDYELPEKTEMQKEIKIKQASVTLPKPEDVDEGFGFVARGGYCKDPSKMRPLTVMHIRPGSVSDRDGRIKPGDKIVSFGNCKVDHLTPENVIALLREHRDKLTLTIEYSVASVDMTAVSGRPIIVEIQKQVNERLGVSIATYHDNGTDSQIFYIENIEAGSVADRCGVLQIGQIITAIQDLRTDKMTINDAIEALKSGQRERIKLRIIPNIHFDQLKWNQSEKSLVGIPDHSTIKGVNSKELLSLTDDTNINTSNTNSLVGSDPLDLQCNCSEVYVGSNSLRNINSNSCTAFSNRPKSVLGLNSEHFSFSQNMSMKDQKKDQLSKSATSLFSNVKSHKKSSLKSVQQVSIDGSHLEELQIILSIDNHGTFGFTLKAHCNHPTERLVQCPQIDHIQRDRPAYICGVLIEGDYIKAIDGLATIGRSLDQINNQLIEANKVVITSLYEVRDPDPQLLVEDTIFEITLKKQSGSLGINLQALVTRTTGEPLLISKVLSGSAASRCGCIAPGDLLLALDKKPIEKCTLAEAVHLLQNSSDSLIVRIKKGSPLPKSSSGASQSDFGVFTVDLKRELPCQPWGIVISGTDDSVDQPILIDSINPSSVASGVSKLSSGDQILSINGHSLRGCTLTQAMKMLHQYPDQVRITVLRQKMESPPAKPMSPNSTDLSIFSDKYKPKPNTRSLSRTENRNRSFHKSLDNDKIAVNSMTLPPMKSNGSFNSSASNQTHNFSMRMDTEPPETVWNTNMKSNISEPGSSYLEPISIMTNTSITTTTESDSSDSQNTAHSLFTKHRPLMRNNPHKEINHSLLSHQTASIDSNSSSASGTKDKSLFLKNPTRKEFAICEEATVIEGSEVDFSQTDILDSIQCPGCREAIENEWRSKEQLNESRSIDRRTNRVHGGAIPMSVNLPANIKNRADSLKSTQESIKDSTLFDNNTAKRSGSEKDIHSSSLSSKNVMTIRLCRKTPTESFGIGVSEGLSPKGTFISAIKPNSPASRCASLNLYDEIIQVNGLSTENMRCSDVVTLISQSENNLELLIRKRKPVVVTTESTSSTSINKQSSSRKLEKRSSSLRRVPPKENSIHVTLNESLKMVNSSHNMKSSSFKT